MRNHDLLPGLRTTGSGLTVESPANRLSPARLGVALLFCLFAFAGSIASVETGLTWDEAREQLTFDVNGRAVEGLLADDPGPARYLHQYVDRYYGIGFHLIARPLQALLAPYLATAVGTDAASAALLAKHPAVFLMFALSVIGVYRLLRIFVRERAVALLFAAAYALYPYLFGHGMLNVKDIPCLSAYLLCTVLSIRMAKHHLEGHTRSFRADFLALLFATGILASIRMPGLVILGQYLVTFAVADSAARQLRPRSPPLLRLTTVLAFPALLLASVVAVYPVLWRDTFDGILDAFTFMGRHPWRGCTLTWGECVPAQELPWTYLPGWLLVKLPLLVLAGLALAPVVWRRISAEPLRRVALSTLIAAGLGLPASAAALHLPLYDESRQLLFIYPLLFVAGSVAFIAASRSLAIVAVLLSLAVFAWDLIRLHPYQYVYFNEAARFAAVDRLFETDYWGASGRELGAMVTRSAQLTSDPGCIYAHPTHLHRPFIDPALCVKSLLLFDREPPAGNYIVAAYARARWDAPAGCAREAQVFRTFPLSQERVTMASAYRCEPP